MSYSVRVRVDGVVRVIEVTEVVMGSLNDPMVGQRVSMAPGLMAPNWAVLLPGYRVHERLGAADGVRYEAFRLGGNG